MCALKGGRKGGDGAGHGRVWGMDQGRLTTYISALRGQACRELLHRQFAEAERTYGQVLALERRYLAGLDNEALRRVCLVRIWHAEAMRLEMGERAEGRPVSPSPPPPIWWLPPWPMPQRGEDGKRLIAELKRTTGKPPDPTRRDRPPGPPKRRGRKPKVRPVPAVGVEAGRVPTPSAASAALACSTAAPRPAPPPAEQAALPGQAEKTAPAYRPSEEELCRLPL